MRTQHRGKWNQAKPTVTGPALHVRPPPGCPCQEEPTRTRNHEPRVLPLYGPACQAAPSLRQSTAYHSSTCSTNAFQRPNHSTTLPSYSLYIRDSDSFGPDSAFHVAIVALITCSFKITLFRLIRRCDSRSKRQNFLFERYLGGSRMRLLCDNPPSQYTSFLLLFVALLVM